MTVSNESLWQVDDILTRSVVHGVWDAESKNIGPYIAPHTNLTEIDLALDLLWRADIEPAKVVLGQGWVSQCEEVRISRDQESH